MAVILELVAINGSEERRQFKCFKNAHGKVAGLRIGKRYIEIENEAQDRRTIFAVSQIDVLALPARRPAQSISMQ